jgi:hypothetical protein
MSLLITKGPFVSILSTPLRPDLIADIPDCMCLQCFYWPPCISWLDWATVECNLAACLVLASISSHTHIRAHYATHLPVLIPKLFHTVLHVVWHVHYNIPWSRLRIRDSIFGITTSYGLDDRGVGVQVPVGSRIFCSPRRPDRLWDPPSLLSNGFQGLFPLG